MSKNILVIDDTPSICEILDILLTEEGYNVKIILNGDLLSETLDSFNPDLLIVDYLMDGMNGAEITSSIREREGLKNIPVIMISANPHYKGEGKKAGVNVFLNKPFDIHELLNTVKKLLKEDINNQTR